MPLIPRLRTARWPLIWAALLATLAGAPALAQAVFLSTQPASLNQGNLRGARLVVDMTGATFPANVGVSSFSMSRGIVPGLTISSVALNAGRSKATLRLHYDGSDFDSTITIRLRYRHTDGRSFETSSASVAPARWVNVSKKGIALTEGGSANTYTVTLESPPTSNVTVTVTSDHTAAVTAAPGTLTFTTTNWATAQTVTVTPVDDNADTVDEVALVTNVATGGGYAASDVASRTVRVTVADDDTRTGTDYDTDDDGLIEISGHAQLNAIRWDLDGDGSSMNSGYSTGSTSAFPSPAANMGCPDGSDSNSAGECRGYELTANIDLDTDGDGSFDSGDAYWRSGAGWDPIGLQEKKSTSAFTATLRGNGHTISNLYRRERQSTIYEGDALFDVVRGARIESLGILKVDNGDGADGGGGAPYSTTSPDGFPGGVIGLLENSTVAGVYAEGQITMDTDLNPRAGGLVGYCAGSTIVASYADVSLTTGLVHGGLIGRSTRISYDQNEGSVWGDCELLGAYAIGAIGAVDGSGSARGGLVGTVGASQTYETDYAYWDRQSTGISTSQAAPNANGKTTAELQAPTGYTGIYQQWDDYDVDGDGRVDADDDAWDFGQANQYPVLKWRGLATDTQFTFQLAGQSDTAPTYTGVTVPNRTGVENSAIVPFQIPPPTGGNGTYSYTVTGLPSGLVFDEDGSGSCAGTTPRVVCGTAAAGTTTVTVTVHDADSNMANSDRAQVTFTITIREVRRVLAAPTSLTLTEGGSATFTVRLNQAPTAAVTVAVASDNTDVTVDTSTASGLQSTLSFSTTNWATAQTVTVAATADPDAVDEAATITASASGHISASVHVAVDDAQASGTDYDVDNDGLIDIDSLPKLYAVRWDADGNGTPAADNAANYAAAFGNPEGGMGCPGACTGYELTTDLTFDTDGDGDVDADDPNSYPSWWTIGLFSATFEGNNHTISHLPIRTTNHGGLFFHVSGTIRNLGLPNVDIELIGINDRTLAPLAAYVQGPGTVIGCWASGSIRAATSTNNILGGLVGFLYDSGRLAASYSTVSVQGNGISGGLVGVVNSPAYIVASYATGQVRGHYAGGLIGQDNGSSTAASYFSGRVTGRDSMSDVGGVSGDYNSGTYINVYYDSAAGSVGSGGQTTRALRQPTSAVGIFADWDDLDVDGDGTADEDPWDFGTTRHYPVLKYGGLDPDAQYIDYDDDDDGLIEISTLAQLNAVRWDLDGNGAPASGNEAGYFDAFVNGVFESANLGLLCPTNSNDPDDNDCLGYELLNDLDFDTDGDDATHTNGVSDSGDAYHNAGAGWVPIGPAASVAPGATTHYRATFDGNGHVIENLYLNQNRNYSGLFGALSDAAHVTSLGLQDAHVQQGQGSVAALAGVNRGRVSAVWVSGSVRAIGGNVGGLIGASQSPAAVVASYSTAAVECTGSGARETGGLVGSNGTGAAIRASYSVGAVSGTCTSKGGLTVNYGTVVASYWDAGLSGIADDADDPPLPPEGLSSAQLEAPLNYAATVVIGTTPTAIYADWDDQDVDGDGTTGEDADGDPWDFGLVNTFPTLKYRGLAEAPQLSAQPPTAPDFGSAAVANKVFQSGYAIDAFQVPAAGAGNGVLSYAESGLPAGLVFDADGTGSCAGSMPRMVCGTPTTDTPAPVTVTITVSDSDDTVGAGDEDTLTFTVEVVTPSAAITAPAALAEATLHGATVTVGVTGPTFEVGASTSHFTLTTSPSLSGLTVASVGTVGAGDTSITLTLGYTGGNFDDIRTFAVTVADAAHSMVGALTTGTINIVPTAAVRVDPDTVSVTEGGADGSYAVVLGGQPTGAVTVTATTGDAAAATADTSANSGIQTTLSFTTTDWNTPQTVTVAAVDDDDASDETVTIGHSATGYVSSAPDVTVNVSDDETAGFIFDADPSTTTVDDLGPLALREDSTHADNSASYSVRLATQPTNAVTVTITSRDTAAVAVGTASLSFTTTNWDTAQSVTLTAVQDTDPNSETVTIRHAATGGGYNGVGADFTATVVDDDVGLFVDTDPNAAGDQRGDIALREGQSRTYTVRLSTLPSGADVTVTIDSDNNQISVSPSSLTFNTGSWNTARTVTVRADPDDDAVGEWGDVTNTANGAQYSGESATIGVTAEDDEARGTDYDADGDFLIEVSSLAQLNAIRWDLDGDGEASAGNADSYHAAFAGSRAGEHMGCLDGPDSNEDGDCRGYELTTDLDFDTDGDGDVDANDPNSHANWTPIGAYAATFEGNNHTISRLTTSGGGDRGLFAALASGATLSRLGLIDVSVSSSNTADVQVGGLVGDSSGTIEACFVRGGTVSVSSNFNAADVGGLVGRQSAGLIKASYAMARVTVTARNDAYVGGLVGESSGQIAASYATGAVSATATWATSGLARAAGLVARLRPNSAVTNSYATGAISATANQAHPAGLVSDRSSSATVTASYWDNQTSGQTISPGGGTGQGTSGLLTPTGYTGIYNAWDTYDTDGSGTVDAADDAWEFGTAYHYPALKWRGLDVDAQRTDYDADDDGLIDVTTLGQLNAIRWDLDGDGAPVAGNAGDYHAAGAFLNGLFDPAGLGLRCPTNTDDVDDNDCLGYELLADLDFDTDGDDATHTSGTLDSGDAYYNSGSGWLPIGGTFSATFDGNGRTISRLTTNRSDVNGGLFHDVSGTIRRLGLPDVYLTHGGTSSNQGVSALANDVTGGGAQAIAVWATGTVTSTNRVRAGGLIGDLRDGARLSAAFFGGTVTATLSGQGQAGGLLYGLVRSTVTASHFSGSVNGANSVAGLAHACVGPATTTASYVAAAITGTGPLGVFQDVDEDNGACRAVDVYFDQGIAGFSDTGGRGSAQTTAALQNPTAATGIYQNWAALDVDGDGAANESPWDFGFPNQHPVLSYLDLPARPQLDAQPDTAPTFGANAVADMTFTAGVPIEEFQAPAATAGNGLVSYAATGLPAGLRFDGTGTDEGGCPGIEPREFCGAPEAVTSAPVTVTVTATDADGNMAAGDRATLTFTVTVNGASFASSPALLTEANLGGATLTVTLSGFTFASGVTAASFELVAGPAIPGLAIDSISGGAVGSSSAVLTLATGAGYGFDANVMLSVRVLAAAHSGAVDLVTPPRPVAPTRPPGLTLSLGGLELNEDPAGGGNVGTYTAVLNSEPTGCAGGVVVSVESGGDVLTVEPGSLTFGAADWSLPRLVTVTAGEDDDAEDERVAVRHAVAAACVGAGYPAGLALPSLEVLVTDADDVFNLAPAAVGSVADLDLDVGGTARVPTAGLFEDDRPVEELSYTVSSSNPSVASARLARGFVELGGLAHGVSTVTLTAWDRDGLNSPLTFLARVGVAVSFGGGASAPEGGVLRLALVASRPAARALSVPYVLSPGPDPATSADEADHEGGAGGVAVIAAGASEAVVEMAVLDDADVEPVRERFTATLAEPAEGAGYGVGANPSAALTIEEGVCDRSAAVRDALRLGRPCAAVADLSRHTSLRLAGIGLGRLDAEDLLQLDRLRLLDLTDNEFAAWPAEALAALPRLDALRLDGNRVRSLPAELGPHPTLAELWLTRNGLAEIPDGALRGLGALERLLLSDNALAELPSGAFAGLAALERLWLDGNALAELPAGLFEGLGRLEMLHLRGNPGAPFTLTAELARTDAEPWAPGPASVALRVATGSPFEMRGLLLAPPDTLPDGPRISAPAGEVLGVPVAVSPNGDGPVTVRLVEPPRLPAAECERGYGRLVPCFDGLATTAGEPLTLFKRPPMDAGALPAEQALDVDDALRLDLTSAFEATPGEALSFTAESSDPAVARVRVEDGELVVEALAEGAATVTVTATDADGQAATLRFEVTATPMPRSQWRGWRTILVDGGQE